MRRSMAGIGSLLVLVGFVHLPLRVPSRHQGYVATLLCAGMNDEDRGHWEDAAKWYRMAREEDPEALTAHLGLAHCLQATGRAEEAERVYMEAMFRWPLDDEVAVHYCRFLHATGRSDKALENLEKVLARSPFHPNATQLKGRILLDTGRVQEAEEIFRRITVGPAPTLESALGLCDCLMAQERWSEAEEACLQARGRAGEDPRIASRLQHIQEHSRAPQHRDEE